MERFCGTLHSVPLGADLCEPARARERADRKTDCTALIVDTRGIPHIIDLYDTLSINWQSPAQIALDKLLSVIYN